ncbi:MAG: P-loop NTPase [Desulfobacterales bacterium]
MKILICGKGGSGKSTLAVLMARTLHDKGYRVLLVDADESNLGLERLMGVEEAAGLTDKLGGKKGAKNRMMEAFAHGKPVFVNERWRFADIPQDFSVECDGIRLLTIGKIHHFGEGCACAMGGLSKTLLSNLETGKEEMVIVDTEAGIEHLGRGVDEGADIILCIVDPSFDSFLLARKIAEIGDKIGKPVYFVLNRTDEEIESVMAAQVDADRIIARVPDTRSLFLDAMEGKTLGTVPPGIEDLCRFLDRLKVVGK